MFVKFEVQFIKLKEFGGCECESTLIINWVNSECMKM